MKLIDIPVRTLEKTDTVSLRTFYKNKERGWLDRLQQGIGRVLASLKKKKNIEGLGNKEFETESLF